MRRMVYALMVVLAVVTAGASIYWYVAANWLADSVVRWTAERRAEGYEISYSEPRISGFPFALRLGIDSPIMAAPGEWQWRGPPLKGRAALWAPLTIYLTLPGRHALSWNKGGRQHEAAIEAASARGRVVLRRDGRLLAYELALGELNAAESGGVRVAIAAVDATGRIAHPTEDQPQTYLDFTLALDRAVLPEAWKPALGGDISRLAVAGQFAGAIRAGPPAQSLRAWSEAGGYLNLESLQVNWGPLDLEGNAGLALDANLQPEGTMAAVVRNHEALIDRLVEAGVVKPRDGAVAKVLLPAFQKPSVAGAAPELHVPLQLQDRQLSVGPIGLARMPRIDWQ